MKKEVYVFGHKNPDTDSISSAISLAYLLNKLDNTKEYIAKRLGDSNLETEFALNYFKTNLPEYIEDVSDKEIVLVDHNERTQTANGFENAIVLGLYDHHKISNFNVSEPLYAILKPYGCTATILYEMYVENNVEIPSNIAGLMLSAIISDTLLFRSPTCTKKDIEVAQNLSKIAKISDLEKYGMEMLKKGADLSSKSTYEILNMDMKEFDINGKIFKIAQVNSFDVKELLSKKEMFLDEMNKENKDTYIFAITDVLNENSYALVVGDIQYVEKAYGVKIQDNEVFLEKFVSRKKQIVPPLMNIK